MRKFFKRLVLPVLSLIEWLFDFYTSPLLPIVDRLKMIFGRYEIGTTRFVKKHLHNGVAFDIGANVGYYARLMEGRAEHVYAFEADPDNFVLLERNCRKYPNITALNVAVSDHDGVAHFFKVKDSAMRHSLIDEGEGTQKIQVRSVTLDTFCTEHSINNISMMKIDVEGAEPQVFAGMEKLLQKERPLRIYEGYDPNAQAIGNNGELVPIAQAPLLGSKRQVTNLVRW